MTTAERARYRVIGDFWGPCTVYRDGAMIETVGMITQGTEVDWDGRPGVNLEPINAIAKAAKEAENARLALLASAAGKPPLDAATMQMIGTVAAEAAAAAVRAVLAEGQGKTTPESRKAEQARAG